jgi:hypothetical protein
VNAFRFSVPVQLPPESITSAVQIAALVANLPPRRARGIKQDAEML